MGAIETALCNCNYYVILALSLSVPVNFAELKPGAAIIAEHIMPPELRVWRFGIAKLVSRL